MELICCCTWQNTCKGMHTTYCILNEQSVCHPLTLQYTGSLRRMHTHISSSSKLFSLFSWLGVGCDVAAHCIVGNRRRGRLVACILGIFSEWVLVRTLFDILQILLVFAYSILHTTLCQLSMYETATVLRLQMDLVSEKVCAVVN